MIKEYERELNELQESKLISKEDLREGDEIIYNGEHYFVTLADTGTDFVWITDDESERYNRNAQGWTIKADWIDEVIGQPEEDELKESLTKSDRDIILDVVKGKYETGHGYLEDKGDYEEALGRRLTDAKYEQLEEFYSDLMDLGPEGFYEEYKDMLDFDPDFIAEYGYSEDDEEEDELEESLKESTNVKERIKNLKDGGSLTKDDQKVLLSEETDCKSTHKSAESKEIIKEDINMTRKEMIDWIEDHWNDTAEHGEWLYGYLTELGFNVEDDSDDEEGFYANLTTGDLRKIVDELKPNTEVSVKEQIADIREALETLGRVSDVSLDYTGAEEATFDVDFKDGNTFRIQIYKM